MLYEILTVILSFVAVILVPAVVTLIRSAVRWQKVEDKLDRLVDRMEQIVIDKDETHKEIITQMREDRSATNRRLRWLEENLWKGRA